MRKTKKPDAVVYNEDSQNFDAAIKPYATNLGAPAIRTTDTIAWKNRNIQEVNAQVNAKYQELKTQFDALLQQFDYNKLVYSAKFSFEPVVGHVYHLYRNKKEEAFLSVIAPDECHFHHLGTFRLNADKMWDHL